jgi:hypothetical protein
MMTRTLTTLVAVATISVSAIAAPTAANAHWRHHHPGFPVAPIVGGLAAGALIGAAVAARPYYEPAYFEPVYFEPSCHVRRERIWDGWRWRIRRVEDCY